MKRPFRGHSQHRAFTLIELLAVIAIIAILAGFLLPMLGRAMDRGRGTQCLAHMRQWGTALTAYLADHAGIFPEEAIGKPATPIYSYTGAWFNVMSSYIDSPSMNDLCQQFMPPRPGQKNIFVCPSLKIEEVQDGSGNPAVPNNPREPIYSYAYNLWLDHDDRASGAYSTRLRVSQILKPSRFVVFGEVAGLGFDNMAGQHLRFRHDGTTTVNIVFADGHAQNFFWTNVFVNTAIIPASQVKSANVGVIWDPEGNPPQTDPVW